MTATYAIVDSAQQPRFHERLDKVRARYISLFDRTAEQSLVDIAPLLIKTTGEPDDSSAIDHALQSLGERKPAVGFFSADSSMESLAAHFRSFHLIKVPEKGGREMLLRWYDTRILPHWLQLLRPDQRVAFVGPTVGWHYYDRFGDKQTLPLPAPLESGFPALTPLQLDEHQYAAFLDVCEPDAVIAQLRRVIPDELRRVPYRVLYPFVREHLQSSRAHGVSMLDDHVQYLLLALYTSGGFVEHPTVIDRLAPSVDTTEESFSTWATELPEDVWSVGIPLWERSPNIVNPGAEIDTREF